MLKAIKDNKISAICETDYFPLMDIDYSATGNTSLFCFVYDNGEV